MPVRLSGSTSGYTELSAPAVAGSNTLTLPTGNGSNGQFLQGNGSGTLSWSGSLTLGTAVASTSGTAIDFTGIPSWVKRVTVMFGGVSTSGTSAKQIRIGTSSGIETTGYASSAAVVTGAYPGAAAADVSTAGFLLEYNNQAAADSMFGHLVLTNLSGNIWIGSGIIGSTPSRPVYMFAGQKTLSGTLDRVRITTVNGTDTFDAGSINIMMEG